MGAEAGGSSTGWELRPVLEGQAGVQGQTTVGIIDLSPAGVGVEDIILTAVMVTPSLLANRPG